MRKYLRSLISFIILLLILLTGFGSGYFVGNYQEYVTSKFILPKMQRVIEENNIQFNKSFVAESEDDLLYTNLRATVDQSYHYLGVSEVKAEITNYNLLSKGKNQCSYIPISGEDDFNLKCKEEEKGIFVNYIIELDITYTENDIVKYRKEKGLVVFVKADNALDFFTWKLVRFNRIIVEN